MIRALSTDVKARYSERFQQVEQKLLLEAELEQHRRFVMLANRRRDPGIVLINLILWNSLNFGYQASRSKDRIRLYARLLPNNLLVNDWRDRCYAMQKQFFPAECLPFSYQFDDSTIYEHYKEQSK